MASRKYVKTRKKSTYVSKGTGSKIVNTGRGSVALKRTTRKVTYTRGGKDWTTTQLYRDTLKQVRQSNAKLASLQRRYKSGTWASKKLMNRLDTETLKAWQGGKIKIPTKLSQTKLAAINKATRQFLQSKTSTKKGINDVKKETMKSLKATLSSDTKKYTDDEIETMYNMLGDRDFEDLAQKIDTSDLWVFIDSAIEKNMSEDNFIDMLKKYTQSFDDNMAEKANRIYNKYVL